MSDLNFESFINRLRRQFSNFLDEEFIMDLENNWYEGRHRTQTLASLICKKIPDDRLTDWIRNGVESIQRAPLVSRSRPKYCESKWESPAVKPTCGYSKEAYSETAISEPDAITFRYHVKVLERGIGNCSERDITSVLSGSHNRNFLDEGLYKIAWRAKDLVKKMKARETIIWMCLEWYMGTLEGILERDINLDEDIPFLHHEEILGEDELEMFKSTYRMLVKLRNHLGNRDNERILEQYQQQLNRAILDLNKAEDDNTQLQNRLENALKETIEVHYILAGAQKETRAIGKSNNEFEKKLTEIKQDLYQTKSELRKTKDEVNSLQNENKEHEKKMRDKQNELKKTQGNLSKAEEENSQLQKELKDACEEIKQVKDSLSRVQKKTRTEGESNRAHSNIVEQELNSSKEKLRSVNEKNDTLQESILKLRQESERYKKERDTVKEELQKENTISSQKGNSKFKQEADQYKQERDRVIEELRKTEKTLSFAQERIDRLERKVEDEQRHSANRNSELQQTLGDNDDLQTRLANAQKEISRLKESLMRVQKDTRIENESILKLRQESERYKKERDTVKEKLQKANERTISSQKGNSKFRQEADQYKQERDRVTKELRTTEETLSSAQERIERPERNVEDEQCQSANAKSELQHTIGINEDLQTKLTNAQKKISQLKDTLSRFQKDTRLEDESILKLRQEAERYKQERDIVKEELQKAYEETISSQKGIVHLQKNLKEQNLPLDSVKLELRQTREENKDLQKRLENSQKETNELKESFSRVRKETRTEDESRSTLRGEAEPYKQERDYLKEELQKAKEKTNSSRERIAQLEQKLEEQHRQMANVKSELRQTQEKNEDLQNRFSQDTAAQLTQENPSIAELSDVNRPTKLAKRFFELYDNEWTDAFTAIEDDPRNVASEEDIAKKLKDILRNCFEECVDISNQQLANIEATLLNPGSGKHTSASRQLTPKQAMTITDLRRETCILSTEHIKQKMCRRFHDSTKYKDLKLFIEKCSELCWLMAVQSPPVVIEDRHRPGDRFNGDVFKAYTKSGKVIEYVVWPPVYLHKGGPLLCKGIAQGKE